LGVNFQNAGGSKLLFTRENVLWDFPRKLGGKEVNNRKKECIKVKATAEHLPYQAAAIPARRFAPPSDILPQLGAGDNLGSKSNLNSDIYRRQGNYRR